MYKYYSKYDDIESELFVFERCLEFCDLMFIILWSYFMIYINIVFFYVN